ncbi:MAG: thiamine-phosphate kinase, partial [Gammaproteobacteria bacterium]|nr:thiamine-phosphate kinase [Gammaproteobacteria bacterium]
QLVTTVDTLVNAVHFPADSEPFDVGYKAMAVNLSDLAAMGAEPSWATLALTMPAVDESWLRQFCDGFFTPAREFNVQLIGGDTTQGPLSVTVQLMGLVPEGKAIKRSGARAGDRIFVSGTVGDAALGLQIHQKKLSPHNLTTQQTQALLERLYRPVPRIELGMALRGIATSMIDISDGLAADLIHILEASRAGATIHVEQAPVSAMLRVLGESIDCTASVLGGGDDYELCFSVAPNQVSELSLLSRQLNINVTEIGVIEEFSGLRILHHGAEIKPERRGFEHFTSS